MARINRLNNSDHKTSGEFAIIVFLLKIKALGVNFNIQRVTQLYNWVFRSQRTVRPNRGDFR